MEDFVTITITHRPEGPDSPDNEAWTKTFSGANLGEVMMQITPWAMLYQRRRAQPKPQPKQDEQT